MNLPDSLSFDTWHMIVNCFACGGPSSPVTVYSGTGMSLSIHNSCNAPTAFSCRLPLYGDVMSDTSSISTVSGSDVDVIPCAFNLLRRHFAASCFASFLERPLPMASKNSHINGKHYLSWITQACFTINMAPDFRPVTYSVLIYQISFTFCCTCCIWS